MKFRGDYACFSDAASRCAGYADDVILDRVAAAAERVRRGEGAYEQDGRVFETRTYVWPVLANLLWIAGRSGQRLHVLDFGGSLGSNYYRHLPYLERLEHVQWSIVEQPNYVARGQRQFQDERLRFFPDIAACLRDATPDVVFLSGVVQYLPSPHSFLAELRESGVEFLLFDRTPFVRPPRARDWLTLQHVGEPNYPATYPAWFFEKEAFLRPFAPSYRLLEEFDSGDHANIPSDYRGLLFHRQAK